MSAQNTEVVKWQSIRDCCKDGDYLYSPNWNSAIKLFENRFRNKFINPLNRLFKADTKSGEGFTIVMVQCALIETFAAFREGKYFRYDNVLSPYEYKDSIELFIKFLTEIPEFNGVFYLVNANGVKTANTPFNSNDFYKKVRCGLMHETRTKGNWKITSGNSTNDKSIVSKRRRNGNCNIIYRDLLQRDLISYFKRYIIELKQDTEEGILLRRNLARKFDQLYDIEDRTAEWWKVLE